LKPWNDAAGWTAALSLYRNQSWANILELIGLKIGWDLARAFLMWATLTVYPPGFLNSTGNSNHGVGGPFHHFLCFSSLTALMKEFSWFYGKLLYPYT
jgi:hypothetical protein